MSSKLISTAFTLKKNVKLLDFKKVTEKDYEEVFEQWNEYGVLITKFYEFDSKGLLHVHGVIDLPKKALYKRLKPPGFHTLFKPITDLSGWEDYIRKDQVLYNKIKMLGIEHDFPPPEDIESEGKL